MKRTLVKPLLYCLIVCVLFSCRKDPNLGNGCISRVIFNNWPEQRPELFRDSLARLLARNNIDSSQYLLWFPPTGGDYQGDNQIEVALIPLYNGLPALDFYDFFFFKNSILQNSQLYKGVPENPDSAAKQTLFSLQSQFLKHVKETAVYNNDTDTATVYYPYTRGQFKDTCLRAALGYIDASEVPGSSVPVNTSLVKVWQVTPIEGNLPTVFVNDETGVAWARKIVYP